MSMSIAIHPDRVIQKNGEIQSFSSRWLEKATEYGIGNELVDARDPSVMDKLARHDAFMWRFPPDAQVRSFAQGFLHAVESGLGKRVFPDWPTRWHMEDKVAQTCMLRALGISTPKTYIFWDYEEALDYLASAEYPLVLKLASGYQSRNVRLLNNIGEARYYARQLFGPGLTSLAYAPTGGWKERARQARCAARVLRGGSAHELVPNPGNEIHRGYIYLQEFIGGNTHDTRITIVGDRAFGFIRRNRPGDFRASGSGLVEFDPEQIGSKVIDTAFRIADHMKPQTIAIDAIRRNDEVVVLELTLSYAERFVRYCPGHWRRTSIEDGDLEWIDGPISPGDAIFEDFVKNLDISTKR